jgi:hypothetical protein
MTWTPRTLPTLDERERAAYAAGDADTAQLCVLAVDGSEESRLEVDTLSAEKELLENDLTDTNGTPASTRQRTCSTPGRATCSNRSGTTSRPTPKRTPCNGNCSR